MWVWHDDHQAHQLTVSNILETLPPKPPSFTAHSPHQLCGPALTAHGSVDLKQEIQIQTRPIPSFFSPNKPILNLITSVHSWKANELRTGLFSPQEQLRGNHLLKSHLTKRQLIYKKARKALNINFLIGLHSPYNASNKVCVCEFWQVR
jgi:hypothetical protein